MGSSSIFISSRKVSVVLLQPLVGTSCGVQPCLRWLSGGLLRAMPRIRTARDERALKSRCAVTKVLQHVMELHDVKLHTPGAMHAVALLRHAPWPPRRPARHTGPTPR